MRTHTTLVRAAAGWLCLAGGASAAELSGPEITKLLSGKSLYLELTAASVAAAGQGVIYYAADGTALYKTAKGSIWHGKWTVKDNTSCTDWQESPGSPCTKWDKAGDTISLLNATTGQVRGKVVKIADGNAEKLAP